MLFKTLCATIVASASAYSNQKPPLIGKYFYADLAQAEYYGLHYIKMKLGSNKDEMHLSISSDQYETGVIDKDCSGDGVACDVPNPWHWESSTSVVRQGMMTGQEDLIFGNNQKLIANQFTGALMWDTMIFELHQYERETTVDKVSFASNTVSTHEIKSEFDGYLGLAPYSQNISQKQNNFLWQLKNANLIEHLVVAVFAEVATASNTDATNSVIKFGSWDQHACLDTGNTDITMFKTTDLKGWTVKATSFMINDVAFLTPGSKRTFEINSHLPFLYLPFNDWTAYVELMQKNYPDIICSQEQNVCYFQQTCEDIKIEYNDLKFKIEDDVGSMILSVHEKDFFVAGSMLGGNADLCYVPVFMSGLGLVSEWQVGSALMKKYYVVYDQTPYDERQETYNFIGIGLQNNDANMLKRHYDYSQPNKDNFKPTAADMDSSHTIPPFKSVYDIKTKPTVLPKPTPVPAPKPKPNPVTPAPTCKKTTPPTHDSKCFMPNEHTNNENSSSTTPATKPVKPAAKTSSSTMVYLISGIGALIFVVIVGFCCWKRGQQSTLSNRKIDGMGSEEDGRLVDNGNGINGGSEV